MSNLDLILYFVVGTLATARITRLVTWDSYPPVAHLRSWWDNKTFHSEWNLLLHCGYCFSVWVAAVNMIAWVFMVSAGNDLTQGIWVGANTFLAAAYAAAIVMAYDGDDD